MPQAQNEKLTLVGAGPVGSLLAAILAERGHEVEVFERRPDMRQEAISAGRSINLALSVRGLHALKQLGMEAQVLDEAVPMRGRMMHSIAGDLTFQPYGKEDSDCIYSISRGGLNKLLMSRAESTGKVKIHFNERVLAYDSDASTLNVLNEKSNEMRTVPVARVIGTDGSASMIRDEVMRKAQASASEEILNYGYKELQLPAGTDGSHLLEKNALHIWPRGTFMLIALPNFDGSFTCTLFLPFTGKVSFETLTNREEVHAFFSANFPDVLKLLPHYEEEFFGNPTGRMITVKCAPWNIQDKAALVGDAAHAIFPFFGQGMNCGFEDCTILSDLMDRESSWKAVFERFSETRKPDADAIADMAVENFIEMRDKVSDPRFLLEKQVERILQREFPEKYISRYSLVTFSRTPYRNALAAGIVHAEILGKLCQGIDRAEQLDLAMAGDLINEHLVKQV
jgi:kynurenine 3-monooxygenase